MSSSAPYLIEHWHHGSRQILLESVLGGLDGDNGDSGANEALYSFVLTTAGLRCWGEWV